MLTVDFTLINPKFIGLVFCLFWIVLGLLSSVDRIVPVCSSSNLCSCAWSVLCTQYFAHLNSFELRLPKVVSEDILLSKIPMHFAHLTGSLLLNFYTISNHVSAPPILLLVLIYYCDINMLC